MNVFVASGADCIGSNMVKRLLFADYKVTILESLSKGYCDSVVYGSFVFAGLADRGETTGFELANDDGFSVKQVVDRARSVT